MENFYSFDFTGDPVVTDEDEEEIDFDILNIENSNKNDESEINKETVILDNPITNKTKEVPVVIIDWFLILKPIKNETMVTLKYNWG